MSETTGIYTCTPLFGSFIFKMAAMLQILWVFPCVSYIGSTKVVQCPCPGPKIGHNSQQIPHYSTVCLRGQPPGMAADKCIRLVLKQRHKRTQKWPTSNSPGKFVATMYNQLSWGQWILTTRSLTWTCYFFDKYCLKILHSLSLSLEYV